MWATESVHLYSETAHVNVRGMRRYGACCISTKVPHGAVSTSPDTGGPSRMLHLHRYSPCPVALGLWLRGSAHARCLLCCNAKELAHSNVPGVPGVHLQVQERGRADAKARKYARTSNAHLLRGVCTLGGWRMCGAHVAGSLASQPQPAHVRGHSVGGNDIDCGILYRVCVHLHLCASEWCTAHYEHDAQKIPHVPCKSYKLQINFQYRNFPHCKCRWQGSNACVLKLQ